MINSLDVLGSIASIHIASGPTTMTTHKLMYAITPLNLYLQDVVADDTMNFITHTITNDIAEGILPL